MNMPSKKTCIISGVVVAALIIVAGLGIWMTSPTRTFDAFMKAVDAKDETAALTFVSKDITQNKQDNIGFFLDDWTTADSVSYKETKNESWRVKDDGDKKTTVPTPHLFAHNFQAFATVSFDDFDDPVVVVLRRKTSNSSSLFAQLFRGWEVVQIKYQPLDESEFDEVESGLDDTGTDTTSDDVNENANTAAPDTTNTNTAEEVE